MRSQLLICMIFSFVFSGFLAQEEGVWLHPNEGQWDDRILFKVELNSGSFYLEKDRFTFDFHNLSEVYEHHHNENEKEHHEDQLIKRHTLQTVFEGSDWSGQLQKNGASSFYRNYYLSSDTSQWASKVHAVKKVRLINFYDGIDLILEGGKDELKYSFEVDPDADPSEIKLNFVGADSIRYTNQSGKIYTRFGAIDDSGLKVWSQHQNGSKKELNAAFHQVGNEVFFDLEDTKGGQKLIIDPSLTFSTFTGSTVDNWGFTAAPDKNGNLYAGGIVFGSGYPTTIGAYDESFNAGASSNFDVGITKFNSTGTDLLYSTYIGGSNNEAPNSLVVNDNLELYILGVTGSTDFPITNGAFQSVHGGGTFSNQNNLSFGPADIFISRLNSDGTALLSSTFYGGSGNDGFNDSNLDYNYGDQFRGDIIVGEQGEIYVASSTKSGNITMVNAFDNSLDGNQDGLAARFSSDLSTLDWSTYIGGANVDAAYSIQSFGNSSVYIAGGTASSDLSLSGGEDISYNGGSADGYVIQLAQDNGANQAGTFVGTPEYDQCYFVDTDQNGNVYVYGQSKGSITMTSGVYSNPNSGQFIKKYDGTLGSELWSTQVGAGSGNIEISPTAFLVSDCNEIYYAGWGGETNVLWSQATESTSSGLPTTGDAYQTTTNGNNFYVAVLNENAFQLNYATFMGGTNSSPNHVDGGTSRFDKKGRIYHAVCGACGGNPNGFTTTPGVWSETNQSSNCNLAAWKFDLGIIESTVSAPDPFVCIPDSVDFVNNSQNGNEYFWDFGDGNTSSDYEPSHFYNSPGTYEVMFVVSDTNGCYESDTSYIQIEIGEFNGAVVDPPSPICPGDPYQLEASGGSTYQWSPAQFLDDSTSATPTAIVDSTTTFTVIISDTCGIDTLTLTLETYGGNAEATEDMLICRGDTVELWATGGVDYLWSDPADIYDQVSPDTVIVAPEFDTEYEVEIYTAEGCTLVETIFIEVFQDVPQPVIEDTVPLCKGQSVEVTASGAPEYTWSPNIDINTTTGPTVTISTETDRWYYIDFTNPCGTVPDSTFIDVIEIQAEAGNDSIVCPGYPVDLWASGGVEYSWSPSSSVENPYDSMTVAQPKYPMVYTVTVTDQYGCVDSATVDIDHYPLPYVQASPDYYGFPGDEIILSAEGNDNHGTYTWAPGEFLSCVNCQSPTATPPESITYEVTFIDQNGCRASDDVSIIFEGIIYVPNTFTPDGNSYNDEFFVKGGNIEQFEMLIFNRWGEVVFETNDFNARWDGTYNGQKCKDGTYVWKIRYEDTQGNREEMVGHVNLLR